MVDPWGRTYQIANGGETYTLTGTYGELTRRYRSYLAVTAPDATVSVYFARNGRLEQRSWDRRDDDIYVWNEPFTHGRVAVWVQDRNDRRRKTVAVAELSGSATRLEVTLP